jgi:hypothetical protein
MSNERLRAAILASGMTNRTLSLELGVDAKTVDRWIGTGRVPHPTHRMAAARTLGCDEIYLWPEAASEARAAASSRAEIVAVYANRGSVPMTTWTSLATRSEQAIHVLAYSASFLHDAIPDFDGLLAGKARDGLDIRLLFADPEAESVRLRGAEEDIGELLAAG